MIYGFGLGAAKARQKERAVARQAKRQGGGVPVQRSPAKAQTLPTHTRAAERRGESKAITVPKSTAKAAKLDQSQRRAQREYVGMLREQVRGIRRGEFAADAPSPTAPGFTLGKKAAKKVEKLLTKKLPAAQQYALWKAGLATPPAQPAPGPALTDDDFAPQPTTGGGGGGGGGDGDLPASGGALPPAGSLVDPGTLPAQDPGSTGEEPLPEEGGGGGGGKALLVVGAVAIGAWLVLRRKGRRKGRR